MSTPGTVTAAAKAASAAVPHVAKSVAERAAPHTSWIRNLPTRAIADALLKKENYLAPHDALYEEVNRTGLFRSHRHFKHCLKMLKEQKRVKIICLGPEKVGSAQLKFSVKLTSRGRTVYRYYREGHLRSESARPDGEQPSLKDALA